MAFIVQQSHPGLRQASNLELTFIQMLQITDPQIQLITADAIDNLLRGHRQQAELQRRDAGMGDAGDAAPRLSDQGDVLPGID